MKKTGYIFFIIFLIAVLVSCNKDSELILSPSNLAGKWSCTSQEFKISGETIHTEKMDGESSWMDFDEDGSGTLYSQKELFEITTHPYLYFEWTIENDLLVTDIYGYMEFNILSLTEKELILESPYSDDTSIVAKFKKEEDLTEHDSK